MAKKEYNIKLVDHMYNTYVPAFTDLFDEETWYIFVACFVAATVVLVFIISRFVTIKCVE